MALNRSTTRSFTVVVVRNVINIGFKILDRLADKYNTKFIVDRHVFYSEIKYRSRKLILIKPTTYMTVIGNV